MDYYTLSSIILTIAVLIGYVNHRYIGLQATVALMIASLLISFFLILSYHFGITSLLTPTSQLIQRTNFQDLLLKGMLSFLLFAGSLTIDLDALKEQQWEIGVLASIATIASALLIGVLTYYLLPLIGFSLPWLYCMLFGALISPTDPIAVLATFKKLSVSKRLQTCIAGESLFNDGVGIVIFTTLLALTFQSANISIQMVGYLFLKQAIGGIAYGLMLSILTRYLMRTTHDHKVMILLTLAMVSGGYSLALSLGISGPLAIVVFGISIGHYLRKHTSQQVLATLQTFWEVIDEILNFILFLLIGFEMTIISINGHILLAMLSVIPLVLIVRLITVAIPIKLFELKRSQEPYTILILTWGGLRGGLALALALSLPLFNGSDLIISITYSVVAFSVIVQGLTIAPLARMAKNKKR